MIGALLVTICEDYNPACHMSKYGHHLMTGHSAKLSFYDGSLRGVGVCGFSVRLGNVAS